MEAKIVERLGPGGRDLGEDDFSSLGLLELLIHGQARCYAKNGKESTRQSLFDLLNGLRDSVVDGSTRDVMARAVLQSCLETINGTGLEGASTAWNPIEHPCMQEVVKILEEAASSVMKLRSCKVAASLHTLRK